MNENRRFADVPAPVSPAAPQTPYDPRVSQALQAPAARPVPGSEPWQFAPPPPREPVPAALHDGGLALAVYLAAWCFLRLGWSGYLGLGMFLFTAAFAGMTLLYRRLGGLPIPRGSFLWLGVMALSALSFPLRENGLLSWLNLLFLMAVTVYWVAALSGTRVEDRLGDCLPADLWNQFCIVPFQNFGCWGSVVKNTFAKTRLGRNLLTGALALLCAFPVLWFVCAQLSSVAAGFGTLMKELGDLVSLETILSPATLLAVPTAFYLFGLLYGCQHKRYTGTFTREKLEEAAGKRRILPRAAAYALLAVLCVIYLLFFITGAAELVTFTRGRALTPYDYSRFAREGFFELCRVSVVNLLVLLGVRLLLDEPSGRPSAPTRIFHSVLCCQTLLLIALALCKMGLYIRCCGVTWLRVCTTWFMALLAVIFGLLLLDRFKKIPLTRWAAASFCALFLLLVWMDVDGLVVRNAIWRYENLGDSSAITYGDLRDSAEAAIPDLYALWERESAKESSPVLPELERLLARVGAYANTSTQARYYSDFAHWNLQRSQARSLTRGFVPAVEKEYPW